MPQKLFTQGCATRFLKKASLEVLQSLSRASPEPRQKDDGKRLAWTVPFVVVFIFSLEKGDDGKRPRGVDRSVL